VLLSDTLQETPLGKIVTGNGRRKKERECREQTMGEMTGRVKEGKLG